MGHKITVFASGNKATMKWIKEGDDVDTFVSEVRDRIGKRETVSPAPTQEAHDIPSQIKNLLN